MQQAQRTTAPPLTELGRLVTWGGGAAFGVLSLASIESGRDGAHHALAITFLVVAVLAALRGIGR